MNLRFMLSAVLCTAGICSAAEQRAGAQEVWAGTYKCGPASGDSGQTAGYTTPVRLVLEERAARVSRDSTRIAETMSGDVAADGTLKLEGTGRWKESGSPGWRYRFDGKFEGGEFKARGEMLSAGRGTKLRECAMALTRVNAPGALPRGQTDKAAAARQTSKPAGAPKGGEPLPPAVADALLPPKEKTLLPSKGPEASKVR